MEINPSPGPYALLKTTPLKNACLMDEFWSGWQTTNHEISLKAAYRKLDASSNWHWWNYLEKAVNRVILRWLLFYRPTSMTSMFLRRDNAEEAH